MHPVSVILLVGLLYLLGFGALSYMRRQGLSTRFAVEGLVITGLAAGPVYVGVPVNPVLFLVILYVVTMRVRLLVDVGNRLIAKGRYEQALGIFRWALRLGADPVGRQIVLINRGVALLKMREPQAAFETLSDALADGPVVAGARYLAAGHYNLGLACRRTGREAQAVVHFNAAIDAWPNSIYARAATRALREKRQR